MFKWLKSKRELKELVAVASKDEQELLSSSVVFLRSQLGAISDSLLKDHHYVHNSFARGYMDGYLDAVIDEYGISVREDMHRLALKMVGYSYFFADDAAKSKVFAVQTLELLTERKDADAIVGRNLGFSEFKSLITSKTQPVGLYNCYIAQR